jgi:hypothetical protein
MIDWTPTLLVMAFCLIIYGLKSLIPMAIVIAAILLIYRLVIFLLDVFLPCRL